ncbi:MAG: type II secretion system protein [Phycisphaerales bacterium]|nr:type II secretion system protein [Phycisphaerales bacterium]
MSTSARSNQSTRAFTLVELTLAIVVASLVMLGVTGVFAAARSMDRIFSNQYENSTQLNIAQMTIRRALLSLQIEEDQRVNPNDSAGVNTEAAGEIEPRPRIILETDPIFDNYPGEWKPQRLEVVLSAPPIALNMATKAAAWARINDRDADSLDFSSTDASGGILRSVFELRPDGSREAIMRRVGIMDPDQEADERYLQSLQALQSGRAVEGWTLWWRPILYTESLYLRDGGIPLEDTAGTEDEIRFRLAGAIPLVSDIDLCSWTVYKSDEKINEYEALSMSSLPAYAEFELLLNSDQYATWMFEIDWVLGEDPLELSEDDDAAAVNGEDADGNNGAGGGNNQNDNGRPGGGVRVPNPNNQNNMGSRGES